MIQHIKDCHNDITVSLQYMKTIGGTRWWWDNYPVQMFLAVTKLGEKI